MSCHPIYNDLISHTRILRGLYEKNLMVLEKQVATFGLYTPPYILVQIEEYKHEIEMLDQKLEQTLLLSHRPDKPPTKYYKYISRAKVEMLFSQIAVPGSDTTAIGYHHKLASVIDTLEQEAKVGTLHSSKLYIRGTLPMCYWPHPANGDLVYFVGQRRNSVIWLGGSMHHCTKPSIEHTADISENIMVLLVQLRQRIEAEQNKLQQLDHSQPAAHILAQAYYDSIDPGKPRQSMEFVATCFYSDTITIQPDTPSGQPRQVRVLIGTPLYVALAS